MIGDGDGHVIGLGGIPDGRVTSGLFGDGVHVGSGLVVVHSSERETGAGVGDGLHAVLRSLGHRRTVMRGECERELAIPWDAVGRRIRVDDGLHAAKRAADALRIVRVVESDAVRGLAVRTGDGLIDDLQPSGMVDVLDRVGDGGDGAVLGDAGDGDVPFRNGVHVGSGQRERQLVEPDVAPGVVGLRLVGFGRDAVGRGHAVEREREIIALELIVVAFGRGDGLHRGRIVRGGLRPVRVREFGDGGPAVVFHVGEQLSLPIVGDGDPHVMFRGIIRDAAPVAGGFPDGVVVRSRPRV